MVNEEFENGNVNLLDEWTPPGGSPTIVTGFETVTAPLPSDKPIKGSFPYSGKGDYPVVLEIDGINVTVPFKKKIIPFNDKINGKLNIKISKIKSNSRL